MSQRASGYERKHDEEYPTPAWCAQIVAKHLEKRVETIWEPASANTALANALRDFGCSVVATSDDFFGHHVLPDPGIDCIVTNPPYGIDKRGMLASDFIRYALNMFPDVRVIAMLLPIDFDSAKSRTDLFRDNKFFAEKLVLLNRIKWFDGPSSPSVNHAWFLWDRRHRGAPRMSYHERLSEWDGMWAKPFAGTDAEREERADDHR